MAYIFWIIHNATSNIWGIRPPYGEAEFAWNESKRGIFERLVDMAIFDLNRWLFTDCYS